MALANDQCMTADALLGANRCRTGHCGVLEACPSTFGSMPFFDIRIGVIHEAIDPEPRLAIEERRGKSR